LRQSNRFLFGPIESLDVARDVITRLNSKALFDPAEARDVITRVNGKAWISCLDLQKADGKARALVPKGIVCYAIAEMTSTDAVTAAEGCRAFCRAVHGILREGVARSAGTERSRNWRGS
jgi:hypothetical protein